MVVDLKQPGGAEVVLRLAEQCDVALESFPTWCRRSAGHRLQGHGGPATPAWYMAPSRPSARRPLADRPGVDGVAQAMSGIMSVTGGADGPPVKVGAPAADMAASAFTSQAVLAALLEVRTGRGQKVDVSLLDALLAFQVVPLSMYLADGRPPPRVGQCRTVCGEQRGLPHQ